jgi:hypothetical protein
MKEFIRLASGGEAAPFQAVNACIAAVRSWIPPAKQEIDVNSKVEKFVNITYTFDANSEWRAAREARLKKDQEEENQQEQQQGQ